MTVRQILYDWGGANVWLLQVINLHSLVQLDALMKGISRFGSYWNLPWVTGGWLAIALWLRKSNWAAGTAAMRQLKRLLVGAVMAFMLTAVLKLALDFPRPGAVMAPGAIHVLEAASDEGSLPSGHAAFAALLAATLWPILSPSWRVIALLSVLAVGVSRIWLGAHFPADVVAGYLVGLCSALWALRFANDHVDSGRSDARARRDLPVSPASRADNGDVLGDRPDLGFIPTGTSSGFGVDGIDDRSVAR